MTREAALEGLDFFQQRRAEDEPWLDRCYVPPSDFALMARPCSTLIYGEAGAGKTALRLAMEAAWAQPGQGRWLTVPWSVNALIGGSQQAPSAVAAEQQAQVLDAVARALLVEIGERPAAWPAASDWARASLAWFAQRFYQGNLGAYIGSLAAQVSAEGAAAQADLLAAQPGEILTPGAPYKLVIEQVLRSLASLDVRGIRIIVDSADTWWELEPERLSSNLLAFLSTLGLFEHSNFIYKMFLPLGLQARLAGAAAIVRRRAEVYTLHWSEGELVALSERRLALALARPGCTLGDLGPAEQLQRWLAGCGGVSPRGWLETLLPLLATYVNINATQRACRPLTEREFLAHAERYPPGVTLDPATQEVRVSWREIEGLGPGHRAILAYLLAHRGRLCGREQLYRAYYQAVYPGAPLDEVLRPAEYEQPLDTALHRLRKAIEPDPAHPVLLQTKKGQGVILR